MCVCPRCLNDLAHRLVESGPAAVEAELAELVDEALAVGVAPAAVAVLRDAQGPEVARHRAFARIAAQIGRSGNRAVDGHETIMRHEHESHYQQRDAASGAGVACP